MKNFFKYLGTFVMPWLSMIIIEENVAAVITFFLQLSLIGWVPGALWACSLLKKHMKAQEQMQTSSKPNNSTNTNVNKDHG